MIKNNKDLKDRINKFSESLSEGLYDSDKQTLLNLIGEVLESVVPEVRTESELEEYVFATENQLKIEGYNDAIIRMEINISNRLKEEK